MLDPNQVMVHGPGDIQPRRPYPQHGPFTDIVDRGNSSYNALEVKVEKRLWNGLTFLSAFTYSKSMNDQPEICCASPWPQNPYDVAADRGLSDFNEKFRRVSSFDYQIPVGKGQRLLNSSRVGDLVLGGWDLGGIFTVRSGFYFSPLMDYDPSNTGSIGLVRTDRTCNGNLPSGQQSPDLWFNTSCFPLPAAYTFGDAGKNIVIGPGGVSGDFALRKVFDNTDVPGAAGVIISTVLPQREMQFGMKLHF